MKSNLINSEHIFYVFFLLLLLLIAIHFMQDWTALWSIELQEKEEKDEKHIGKLIRKNSQIKGVC